LPLAAERSAASGEEIIGMPEPIVPFWFKQRQCKYEPAGGDYVLKVTGPNLGEAFIRIQQTESRRWQAAFRRSADGPDVAVTEPNIATEREAWDAAFELYRENVIV
jgi:hypothetical protein